jgi:hypothetical protein
MKFAISPEKLAELKSTIFPENLAKLVFYRKEGEGRKEEHKEYDDIRQTENRNIKTQTIMIMRYLLRFRNMEKKTGTCK